jgi:uncharacterized membrane protein
MLQRNQIADLLKGLAVLFMIQVHVLELFATEEIYNNIFGKIILFLGSAPVAPIFTILFGYFIASSKKTTNQLIKRGFGIFCLGMILNISLNFNLLYSVFSGKINVNVYPYIFGVDILHFAGLSLIIIALLDARFKKQLLPISIVMLISVWLGSFLLNYLPSSMINTYPLSFIYGCSQWSYFPLFPWLAYPLIGILFYRLSENNALSFLKNNQIKLAIVIIGVVFFVLSINYAGHISQNLQLYYHHNYLYFIWCIAFVGFYTLGAVQINKWFGTTNVVLFLKWMGKHVTLIYCIQWIIIGNIATEIFKTVISPINLEIWYLSILITTTLLTSSFLKFKACFAASTK